jgi:dTDP-4-dehydrorhamnose reductase
MAGLQQPLCWSRRAVVAETAFLVTGGGGQVGRAFRALLPLGRVLSSSELDITNPSAVAEAIRSIRPAVVVNAAAYTKVDAAEAHAVQARRVNVEAVGNLANAARKVGATLVQISSDYVFSGDKPGAYTETDPTGPRSVYGRTKLDSEEAAEGAGEYLVVRASWVYGDGTNFIKAILSAARTREELSVVNDQFGMPTHAGDLAAGILGLLDKGCRGLFHLAGAGAPGSWADVAETALRSAGLATRVRRVTTEQYYATREGPIAPRPANSTLDCSKALAAGVSIRPWRQAVQQYVTKELAV